VPKRGIEQHLRNFEAIALELEPTVMVNEERVTGNGRNMAAFQHRDDVDQALEA